MKFLTLDKVFHEFSISSCKNVEDIKNIIHKKLSIPLEEITLIYDGQILNDQTLETLGLADGNNEKFVIIHADQYKDININKLVSEVPCTNEGNKFTNMSVNEKIDSYEVRDTVIYGVKNSQDNDLTDIGDDIRDFVEYGFDRETVIQMLRSNNRSVMLLNLLGVKNGYDEVDTEVLSELADIGFDNLFFHIENMNNRQRKDLLTLVRNNPGRGTVQLLDIFIASEYDLTLAQHNTGLL